MCALQLLGKMPAIHLFVVSIESLQQQGIELTDEIEKVIPELVDSIKNLLCVLQQGGENIDDLDGDLTDWQKQLIDQRLKAIADDPGRLHPIEELLPELDNEK